jgi:tetratricopeptide (TPR) repeat protein
MQSVDFHKGFADSLGHLLKRFCPEALLKSLNEQVEHLRLLEAEIMGQAKGKESDLRAEHSILEAGYLENIITECACALGKREFLELLVELGSMCIKYGEHSAAKAVLSKVIEAAGSDQRYASASGTAYCKRAELRLRQAHWTGAQVDLKKATTMFKKAKDSGGMALVENCYGVYASEQGDVKKATSHFRKAQTGFEKSSNVERANMALMNLGILSTIAGRWDEALAHYQRILPQFEKLGQMSRLVEVHHNIGMLFLAKNDLKAAINQFDESLTYANQLHYRAFSGLTYLGKAAAYARLEDYPLAMVFAQKALSIFRQLNDQLSIADTYKVKGIIHRELDHPQLAELYFRTSVRLNEEYKSPLNLGETYAELAKLYKRTHQNSKASQAVKKAVTYFKKVGAQQDARNAQAILAA